MTIRIIRVIIIISSDIVPIIHKRSIISQKGVFTVGKSTKKKNGRKIPEVLTEEEQKAVLEQPNDRYPTGERNYLIMRIMLDAGLRLSESINLEWKNINLVTGKLMVREGKGSKDRTLWINEELIDLLQHWKERQAEKMGKVDNVFTTLKGKPLQGRYIRKMVKRYAEKAGIVKNISPHTFRHTFATDIYRESKNIRLCQKALGHADLSTTMIYTHIVDDELEKAMKTFRDK